MKKVAATVLAISLLAGGGCASKAEAHKLWRACPQEDSVNCVWDAAHRGNHQGHSFWVSKRGRVHYISSLRAERMMGAR